MLKGGHGIPNRSSVQSAYLDTHFWTRTLFSPYFSNPSRIFSEIACCWMALSFKSKNRSHRNPELFLHTVINSQAGSNRKKTSLPFVDCGPLEESCLSPSRQLPGRKAFCPIYLESFLEAFHFGRKLTFVFGIYLPTSQKPAIPESLSDLTI